ncbi:hypothetical protein QR680_002643 [Steinernema hermaphroditum]|uniref:Uncharacterized protein n=1 Tax=Steinernema hermaphroditum TaxID=289476 RepID=A0AA39LI35_9BILA|nr:hypothetical protein QR680_002643 [Steinernema hermaphroditum]
MKYRRFFVALVLMVTAFLCVHYFLGFEDEPPNKPQTKQESFDPPLMENSCRFPLVEPLERNIHEYVNLFKAVHCGTDMPNLASVDENNVLTIHYELEPWKQSRTPSFRCEYQSLSGGLSPNIMNYVLSEERIEVKPNEPVFVPHDQFVVTCRNTSLVGFLNGIRKVNDSVIYVNTFAGFSRTKQIPTVSADPNKPSLAILVLDSTAHNQFVRHMPKTIEFMQKLGFITLNGYVKVGDNSAVNLLPVLGGRSILPKIGGDGSEVLPEGEVVNLENVDFLFDFMKERKCVTLFNDDILDVRRGLFHYPNETFLGFRRSPADYYFRPFHLYNTRNLVFPINGGQCMKNGDINVERYLDIWERFSLLHKDKCHFSFNFLTGLTHDESSNLGAIDNRLRTSLESLFANDAMKSTAFVIMGDHGNRIGSIQRSYVGRVEERMPMFSIYLPEAFRITHPQYIQNLMFNANRQSTEFTGVRAALKESLTKFPCLNAHRLTIKDDRLQTLVLNQMVRHGLRNASAYDKVKNVQAAMEILFFDVNASVRTFYTQKTVDLRARVKHYVKEFTFEVASFVAVVFSEKLNATTPIDLKLICNTVDT